MAGPVVFACILCLGTAAALPALSQAYPDRGPPPAGWTVPPGSYAPRGEVSRLVPLVQLDATALLEPSPPREAPPRQRPMFSDGWTRDGFGGQPRGWR